MSYTNASADVLNISDLIFERLRSLGHAVETIKVQKLLYYANAWSLTLRKKALFEDDIQAWKHGPVVASLYGFHRGKVVLTQSMGGDSSAVSSDDRAFVNRVIDAYGDMSGWALRDRTHNERPWIDAWDKSRHGSVYGVRIEQDAMVDYFSRQPVPHALKDYENL